MVTIMNEAGTGVVATGNPAPGFSLQNGGDVTIVGAHPLVVHGEYQVTFNGNTRGMMCTALVGAVATFH
jgi:hypothetical protein